MSAIRRAGHCFIVATGLFAVSPAYAHGFGVEIDAALVSGLSFGLIGGLIGGACSTPRIVGLTNALGLLIATLLAYGLFLWLADGRSSSEVIVLLLFVGVLGVFPMAMVYVIVEWAVRAIMRRPPS